MTTMTTMTTKTMTVRSFVKATLSALALAGALGAAASPALAGQGSSPAAVLSAIRSDSPDAITSELERSELLVCGACVPYVTPLVDHPVYAVRKAAAWWLARRGVAHDVYLDMLGRLGQADSTKARNAADVIGELQAPGAIPALGAALSNPVFTPEARVAMASALGRMRKPEAATALASALADGSAEVRAASVAGLRNFYGNGETASVIALLGDDDAKVRAEAAVTLGRLRTQTAAPKLAALLASDPDVNVRRKAAWALGAIKAKAADAGPALQKAASSDASPLVRSLAQAAIASLQP